MADRARGLGALRALRDRSNLATLAAEVIAGAAMPDFQTITIDKGARDGLRGDMAVIAPAGVVGRVVVLRRGEALVELHEEVRSALARVTFGDRGTGRTRHIRSTVADGYVSEVADVVVGTRGDVRNRRHLSQRLRHHRVETVERAGGAYKRSS